MSQKNAKFVTFTSAINNITCNFVKTKNYCNFDNLKKTNENKKIH